jgi:ABC-2 type transport system ATP-binding protein
MQEVQALCDRVVVINKGKIVADDSLQKLLQRSDSNVSVMVEFEGNVEASELSVLKGVIGVQEVSKGKFSVIAAAGADIRPELFRFAADKNLSLIGLKQEEASLENIFRDLTVASTSLENES